MFGSPTPTKQTRWPASSVTSLAARRWAVALVDTGDGINAPADQLRRDLFDVANPTSLRSRRRLAGSGGR